MKRKKIIVSIFVLVMLFAITITANAAEMLFTSKYVDSNTYSEISTSTKQNSGSYGTVQITNIYKADGSSSDYQCVYCKATKNGEVKLVYKGNWVDLKLPGDYQMPGRGVTLFAMGHNPKLDCRISGYWSAH